LRKIASIKLLIPSEYKKK